MIYLKQGKKGVSLRGLRTEMLVALSAIALVFKESFDLDTVITCGTEGRHGKSSKHYTGHALDFRTRQLDAEHQKELASDVRLCLGDEFDVVLHSSHLHVEFDPKGAINL